LDAPHPSLLSALVIPVHLRSDTAELRGIRTTCRCGARPGVLRRCAGAWPQRRRGGFSRCSRACSGSGERDTRPTRRSERAGATRFFRPARGSRGATRAYGRGPPAPSRRRVTALLHSPPAFLRRVVLAGGWSWHRRVVLGAGAGDRLSSLTLPSEGCLFVRPPHLGRERRAWRNRSHRAKGLIRQRSRLPYLLPRDWPHEDLLR